MRGVRQTVSSGLVLSFMLQAVKPSPRKKGLYTYLQYTQLLAKKSDLQPFSEKPFSVGGVGFFK